MAILSVRHFSQGFMGWRQEMQLPNLLLPPNPVQSIQSNKISINKRIFFSILGEVEMATNCHQILFVQANKQAMSQIQDMYVQDKCLALDMCAMRKGSHDTVQCSNLVWNLQVLKEQDFLQRAAGYSHRKRIHKCGPSGPRKMLANSLESTMPSIVGSSQVAETLIRGVE